MATLKVNLSKVGNACDQDPTPSSLFPGPGWYVFLYTCNGQPFVHAGKEYGPYPVDHGYVEIKDVPSGRYLLFAIVNPFLVSQPIPGGEVIFQSNYASHFAVVEVCCPCTDVCVTLYNSGWHYCVSVIIYWFQLLTMQKLIEPAIANNAIEALNQAIRAGGKTLPGDETIIKQLAEITKKFKAKKGSKE